jgi:hypothetical protein
MQVFANLLGDTVPKYDTFWTPLGVVRFTRAGWDSRLGPSDGTYDHGRRQAVTFAPEWRRMRRWVRLAEMSEHYQGTLYADLVHPMLVRCRLLYAPVTGVGGPNFFLDLTLTPDGVLATLHSPNEADFGLTLPLLENDGRALDVRIEGPIASTAYPEDLGDGDEQCFLVLNDTPSLESGRAALSTYGWLRPVRVTADADRIDVFVYPRNATDPTAEDILDGFARTSDGFASPLGRVDGARYLGRTAAGGVSDSLSLRTDTAPEVTFDSTCGFMVLHAEGNVTAIEADRNVTAIVQGAVLQLEAFVPRYL